MSANGGTMKTHLMICFCSVGLENLDVWRKMSTTETREAKTAVVAATITEMS